MEKRRRSIAKAFSWRITATITTVIISYIITKQIDTALKIGLIEVFAKMLIFYGHERLWLKSSFGLIKENPDYQI
jgi:uncharacterized membrane protein